MLLKLKRLFSGGIRPNSLARLTLPVNILFVVLVAHTLAQLSGKLFTPSSSALSRPEQSVAGLPLPAADGKSADYSAIAGWHLFGKASETKQTPPLSPVQAPETKLNLKLVGIFFSKGAPKAMALIAEGSGEELNYAVGDQLPQSKARLEQILRDRVVLSRNGRLETLSLPLDEEGGSSSGVANLQPPSFADEFTSEGEAPIPIEEAADTSPEPEAIDVSAIANRYRDRILTQPQDLQDLALTAPYVQNGQFMGFRLRPGRDRELLAQLGLRAGDVITAVNGTRLDDPAKGLGLLQQLLNADEVSIQVMRNGTEIPFTFILNSQ